MTVKNSGNAEAKAGKYPEQNGKVNAAANFNSPLVLDLDGAGLELSLLGT